MINFIFPSIIIQLLSKYLKVYLSVLFSGKIWSRCDEIWTELNKFIGLVLERQID